MATQNERITAIETAVAQIAELVSQLASAGNASNAGKASSNAGKASSNAGKAKRAEVVIGDKFPAFATLAKLAVDSDCKHLVYPGRKQYVAGRKLAVHACTLKPNDDSGECEFHRGIDEKARYEKRKQYHADWRELIPNNDK